MRQLAPHQPCQKIEMILMDTALQTLFDSADAAAQNAYAPYSNFSVGAAILTASGKVYSGCNVENAAYPLGSCAEAGAISAMVLAGETSIVDIAIVSAESNPCYPCGGCRQRISEFSTRATRVHLRDGVTGKSISHSMDDLLPHSFGPRDLKIG